MDQDRNVTMTSRKGSRPNDPAGKSRKNRRDTQDLRDDIAVRAYLIWEASGRESGHDVENWLAAEKEVATRKSHS